MDKRSWTATLCLAACAAPAAAQLSVEGTRETARSLPPPKRVIEEVRGYRAANQERIVRELREFLAIPNVASDTPNILKNAARLKEMLEARGIETHLLSIEGRGPVVFGKLATLGARRTLVFYAHYDGQPVVPAEWTDGAPFEPVLRDKPLEEGGRRIPFPEAGGAYQDDWRIYARSASDDKSPIVAMLAALDALRAKRIPLGVNLKFILDGEEEAGSAHLEETLRLHKNLLAGDLLLTGDGPVHPSGRPLLFFGNRGDIGLEMTVYGPVRPLHSGHYGNWAPNPALSLARLLAAMKDPDGRVLIPGYYQDAEPLGPRERAALEAMPANEAELQRELAIAKPDGAGRRLVELLAEPSLNIRGFRSANVGEQATNVVPDRAVASLDARLVGGQEPREKFRQIRAFLLQQGAFVVDREPTLEERRGHALVVKLVDQGGYRASRTSMDLPAARALVRLAEEATDGRTVVAPMLGGSVPMYIFEDLRLPWVGVPIVNYDNHQHGPDENLRLGNLWQGMETYAVLLAALDWPD